MRIGFPSPIRGRANGWPSKWRSTSSARALKRRPVTSRRREQGNATVVTAQQQVSRIANADCHRTRATVDERFSHCHNDRETAMAAPPISRYPVPTLAELPDDIRARMLEVQEKAGFIPNVFLTLAHRPEEFRAFFAYHDALMLRDSGLTKAEREMIVVATSAANDCLYCIVAHGAILRIYAKNPLVADQVGVNYRKADITPRQKAMLAFALKVATKSVN